MYVSWAVYHIMELVILGKRQLVFCYHYFQMTQTL